jgi:hypothetical protein
MSSSMRVALYLHGTHLSPEVVSKALTRAATKSWSAGDVISGASEGSETRVIAKSGLWMLQSASSSRCINDHIDEITGALSLLNEQSVFKIQGVEHAKLDIFILEAKNREFEFSISNDRLSLLSKLGVGLDCALGYLDVVNLE